ncbi:hypothetical protein [Thalassolituus oleivorans]|uniref:Uncharacterized protein n=1 Tax=Thalassolituus oleivorans MIL-1 TaxID=1298593 RepID=M5DZM6_9GAMM|nr:hypothetical protein [Thalassolituus oleivorans]CCU70949.1 hypothetical protein TOL_0510 [Thalassolituus oleivorans MIL-1]
MSEYKLEDAETVTLADATKIIGLDANGVPCWIDPSSLAQGGFKAWLDTHSDIVNYWWPDKSDVGYLAKSGRRCTDFNSTDTPILVEKEGVRVYAALNTTNENLIFQSLQTDQISVERSEIGIFYIDPAISPATDDRSELMYCASNGNFQGMFILHTNDQYSKWTIGSYCYPYNSVPVSAQFGTDDLLGGWVMVHAKTTMDRVNTTVRIEITVSNATQSGLRYGSGENTNVTAFRITPTTIGVASTYAGSAILPAFYAKSRVPLTEVEADDIFNRFKAGYGIA